MSKEKEIYIINEVCLPTEAYGIQEQTTQRVCVQCGRLKSECKCK